MHLSTGCLSNTISKVLRRLKTLGLVLQEPKWTRYEPQGYPNSCTLGKMLMLL